MYLFSYVFASTTLALHCSVNSLAEANQSQGDINKGNLAVFFFNYPLSLIESASMSSNFCSNQYGTNHNDLTQKEDVKTLYLEWKRNQQIEKAKVLAANIDIFFGGMLASDTSSITSVLSRDKKSVSLTRLIKRGCAKIFHASKPMRSLENSVYESNIEDAHQLPSTATRLSNSIYRDHRNIKGRNFNVSDFDLMFLEINYDIYKHE